MQEKEDITRPDPVMRIAQAAVVVMTLVLVIGASVLVVRWNAKRGPRAEANSVTAPGYAVGGEIPLPAGSRVLSTSSGEHFVDVLVEHADGSRAVYQVERASAEVAGVIRFRPTVP